MTGIAEAQRAHDRRLPEDLGILTDKAREAEDLDRNWKPVIRKVSDAEIEAFIAELAETGYYDDEWGNAIAASPVHKALAIDWTDNRRGLPGTTYLAFWEWATACTRLAKRGK